MSLASRSPRLDTVWDSGLAFIHFDLSWIPGLGHPFPGRIIQYESKFVGLQFEAFQPSQLTWFCIGNTSNVDIPSQSAPAPLALVHINPQFARWRARDRRADGIMIADPRMI
jgi:hypothetical protein